jgi:hypothetical protein
VGLSQYHTVITYWVTSSNFIPLNGNPNDSDLSGHEYAIVMCLDEAEYFFDTKALDPNPNDLTT